MIARRSAGSAIVPSGASRRAWSWPKDRTPGRRMTSAAASATAGAGGHAPGAARDDDEVRRGRGVEARRRGEEALDGGPGGREAEQGAVAGGVAPRRERELAQPIADSEAVERDA